MTVEELKRQAEMCEQQGQFKKALALYRHALSHLEGTKALHKELDIYLKAGALYEKMGDPKSAVVMYEKGGTAHAQLGQVEHVMTACLAVQAVAPQRSYVYLRLARLMMDHGHVDPAAVLLGDYAHRNKLKKASDLLRGIGDHGDADKRPILEVILEIANETERDKVRRPSASASIALDLDRMLPPTQETEAVASTPPVGEVPVPPREPADRAESGTPAAATTGGTKDAGPGETGKRSSFGDEDVIWYGPTSKDVRASIHVETVEEADTIERKRRSRHFEKQAEARRAKTDGDTPVPRTTQPRQTVPATDGAPPGPTAAITDDSTTPPEKPKPAEERADPPDTKEERPAAARLEIEADPTPATAEPALETDVTTEAATPAAAGAPRPSRPTAPPATTARTIARPHPTPSGHPRRKRRAAALVVIPLVVVAGAAGVGLASGFIPLRSSDATETVTTPTSTSPPAAVAMEPPPTETAEVGTEDSTVPPLAGAVDPPSDDPTPASSAGEVEPVVRATPPAATPPIREPAPQPQRQTLPPDPEPEPARPPAPRPTREPEPEPAVREPEPVTPAEPEPPPPSPTPASPLGDAAGDFSHAVLILPDLDISSIHVVQVGGRDGWSVTQHLPSGDSVVLTGTVFGDPTAPSVQSSPARVTRLPNGSVVGTVRYGPFLINARSVVAEEMLASLLTGLIRIDPPR